MSLTTQDRMYIEQRIANDAKSPVIAYALWFFLGGLGAHRFYLGRTGSAVGMLALTIVGCFTIIIFIGIGLLLAMFVWWIVDAFLIASIIDEQKQNLRREFEGAAGGGMPMAPPVDPNVDTSRWSAKDRAEHEYRVSLLAAAPAPAPAQPAVPPAAPFAPVPPAAAEETFGWRLVNGERKSFTAAQFEASLDTLRKPLTAWEVSIRRLERAADSVTRGALPPPGAEDEAITLLGQIDEAAAKYGAFVRTLGFSSDEARDRAHAFEAEYDRLSARLATIQSSLAPPQP